MGRRKKNSENSIVPLSALPGAESCIMDGDKLKMEDILDKEIILLNCKITKSKAYENSKCAELHYYFSNDATKTHYITFTSSEVIIDKLNIIASTRTVPFNVSVTPTRIGKYLTLK